MHENDTIVERESSSRDNHSDYMNCYIVCSMHNQDHPKIIIVKVILSKCIRWGYTTMLSILDRVAHIL